MQQRSSVAVIATIALIAMLAVLNVYQYLAHQAAIAEQKPISDEEVVNRFHELYYRTPYWNNRWWNVPTLQNPNDAWITQEIITEVKPDFIVETGTFHGGSAALWAMVLQQVNPDGRVITIDIEDQVTGAKELPIFQQKVDMLVGSSTAPEIVQEVKRRVHGGTVMVLLDSLHTRDHVLEELKLYAPLVSVGSYIIVQDTNINGHPIYPEGFSGPGPWEAVEAFRAEDDRFKPDPRRERMLFTMHPRGYLKRIN